MFARTLPTERIQVVGRKSSTSHLKRRVRPHRGVLIQLAKSWMLGGKRNEADIKEGRKT